MTDPAALESLFLAALARPPADRAAFLAGACPDPAARASVEALLSAHAKLDGFLEPPAARPTASLPPDGPTGTFGPPAPGDTTGYHGAAEDVGAVVAGRYKLLERIGEGGMGTVFLAAQTEPVKRTVAVKLIKEGMDSRAVLARFEAERQALALMDHPNIAKVLDAGTSDSGRPYFVMELVKGVPITEFCDARKLTPQQRLELFVPVCNAIQHAHQKGVIHRDIKPSNVLVAMYDERPVPKVIDFGIAKATGAQLTDRTLHTGFGGVVGTPEYMSPEQATFNQLDVDTRSDVYALGVLLYELLAGSPPFRRKELEKAGLLELLRVVREEEPPKPSTKLSTADALPALSASRGTEPKRLAALLRGELDWIVMKALEKDRNRRYETANGFAADIQRYLSGEPVQAVPPSLGYRLKKAYRRNKTAVRVATAFVCLALGAAAMGAVLAVQARSAAELAKRNEDAANDNARDARDAQARATDEERKARAALGEARRIADVQRRTRYAAEMNLVQAAYNANDLAQFRALLDRQKPQPGEDDLRGFEWHYWDRRMNGHISEVSCQSNQGTEQVSGVETFREQFLFANGTRLVTHSRRTKKPAATDPFSKYGLLLTDHVYRVWDAATGKMLHEHTRAHTGVLGPSPTGRIKFHMSPDGKRLAVSRSEGLAFAGPSEFLLWNLATDTVQKLDWLTAAWKGKKSIGECHFSDDLETVVTASAWDGSDKGLTPQKVNVLVHRVRDGHELMRFDADDWVSAFGPGDSHNAALSPDGSHLVARTRLKDGKGERLVCWKVGVKEPIWDQPTPKLPPGDAALRLSGEARASGPLFRFTPDGTRVVVLGRNGDDGIVPGLRRDPLGPPQIDLHDARTGQVTATMKLDSASALLGVNNEWVAVLRSTNTIGLIPIDRIVSPPRKNLRNFSPAFPLYEVERGVGGGFAFTADGRQIVTAGFPDERSGTLFARTFTVLSEQSVRIRSFGLHRFDSPDGNRFAVASPGGAFGSRGAWYRIFDGNGRLTHSSPPDGRAGEQGRCGFSADGRYFFSHAAVKEPSPGQPPPAAAANEPRPVGETIQILDLRTNRVLRYLTAEPGEQFHSIEFSPDGNQILVGVCAPSKPFGDDPRLWPPLSDSVTDGRVYDVSTGRVLVRFAVPAEDAVDSLAFDAESGEVRGWCPNNANNPLRSPACLRWDAKTGKPKGRVDWVPPASPPFAVVSESRDRAVHVRDRGLSNTVMPPKSNGFEVWNAADTGPDAKPIAVIRYEPHILCRLSPDGRRLVTFAGVYPMGDPISVMPPKVWDTATGRELLTLSATATGFPGERAFGFDCSWSADGTRLWYGLDGDGQLFGLDGRPLPEPAK